MTHGRVIGHVQVLPKLHSSDACCLRGPMNWCGDLKLQRSRSVEARMKRIGEVDVDCVVRFYEDGLTICQAAEKVGCFYGTVRTVLHHSGVRMQPAAVGKR